MSRFPIRLRLTLAFALAMAIVLAATGAFLYFRLGASLDEAIDEGLETRARELAPLVQRSTAGLEASAAADDERFVQVLAEDGQATVAWPQVGNRPLLSAAQVRDVLSGRVLLLDREEIQGVDGRARLRAIGVGGTSPRVQSVLVVGASLEERDEALAGFLGELFIIGPVALVLASLLGYGIGTAALRPVEAMRAEAGAISAAEPGRRLPVPAARDEIARLAETLNEMLGRLERGIERERSFVADASHELRTPLALLKAELELALRRPRTAAELEEALRSAAAETDRLSRLAEDLLVLARSDREELPLRRESVPVEELLTRVAKKYGAAAEANGRSIHVDVTDGLVVDADALRLEQALGNVVDNALRHGAGAIHLSAVASNGSVELHVIDEGRGFPPAFLPRAFERFTRADEARTGGGAGLGLAIAAVIAEAHGGEAKALNRDGAGADVWLSIPTPRLGTSPTS
jgi:two-component system, OmpR family, sensor kinase